MELPYVHSMKMVVVFIVPLNRNPRMNLCCHKNAVAYPTILLLSTSSSSTRTILIHWPENDVLTCYIR